MAGLITRPFLRTSQHCSRRNISLSAVAGDALSSSSDPDSWQRWRDQKSTQLTQVLLDPASPPSRVWAHYRDFFSQGEPNDLALEVHQKVLRRCVAPTQAIRQSAARRLREHHGSDDAKHIYETRLQRVIHMMRVANMRPTLDDYNFVLEQFAAAGYQHGALQVFREVSRAGWEPNGRTYGLVLQAVAHRLELPCAYKHRSRVVSEASQICDTVLTDMAERGISSQSVHVDLFLRIMRTTGDMESFLGLLRQAYGIDLENPDRLPLTAADNGLPSLRDSDAQEVPDFQPFSVHVLNTVINHLGSAGRVSQMMLAFEVLTNPLPKHSNSSPSSDEDEDAHAFYDLSYSSTPSHTPPSASPNSTTFTFLIKHLARLKQHHLVRHYLLDAIRVERNASVRLDAELGAKPWDEIAKPKVNVRSSVLQAALGLGNRTRHVAFLMWLWRQTKWLVIAKQQRLNRYWRVERQLSGVTVLEEDLDFVLPESVDPVPVETENLVASSTPEMSESESAQQSSEQVPIESWKIPAFYKKTVDFHPRAPFPASVDLDLDAPSPMLDPPRVERPFSLELHISVLQKDLTEIKNVLARIRRAVWRLVTRRKEALGRRVWAGKTIYLASEGRTTVSREKWIEIVGFKEPWKTGKKASLVKLQVVKSNELAGGKGRTFVLPHAVPYDAVERRFINLDLLKHRLRVQWRRS